MMALRGKTEVRGLEGLKIYGTGTEGIRENVRISGHPEQEERFACPLSEVEHGFWVWSLEGKETSGRAGRS